MNVQLLIFVLIATTLYNVFQASEVPPVNNLAVIDDFEVSLI